VTTRFKYTATKNGFYQIQFITKSPYNHGRYSASIANKTRNLYIGNNLESQNGSFRAYLPALKGDRIEVFMQSSVSVVDFYFVPAL